MVRHFFASLSPSLGAAIHLQVQGQNTHHMIEALFKGAGRALRPALARQGFDVPSTKGCL
jgi:imidazoleglycerol phosphate dehydratase HisB